MGRLPRNSNRLPDPDKLASPPLSPPAAQLLPPPLADRLAAQLERLAVLLASLLGPLLARLSAPLGPLLARLSAPLAAASASAPASAQSVPSTRAALVDLVPPLCVLALLVAVPALVMRRFFGLRGASASASPAASTASSASHSRAELHKQPWTGRLAGSNEVDPHRPEDVLTIKHGSSEYLFKYPVRTIASHALTLGHVRHKCAQLAGDARPLTLLCAGHHLDPAHDDATLQSLGVEHGARILVVPSSSASSSASPALSASSSASSSASMAPQHAPAKHLPAKPAKPGPAGTIEAVRSRVAVDLQPDVRAFVDGGSSRSSANSRAEAHRRLSETIMGELLKLDGVETDDPHLRARRKEVVREIQAVLDSLDRSLREHP